MTDTTPENGGTVPTTSSEGTGAPEAAGDLATRLAEAEARAARHEAELSKVRAENAERRTKAKNEEARALAALEEQGKHKEAADLLRKQLAELQPHSEAAAKWRAFEEGELKRIAQVREALQPHEQTALDAVPTLEGKRAVLDAFEKNRPSPTSQRSPAKPPVGGAPAGSPQVEPDFGAIANDAVALRAARLANPDAWERFISKLDGTQVQPLSTHARLMAKAKQAITNAAKA